MRERKSGHKTAAYILLTAFLLADTFLWRQVMVPRPAVPVYHQLDVGQGDSELIQLPGGAAILTDAGPDARIVTSLAKAAPEVRRIDLAVISHPQLDHFNGFNHLLKKYPIGAVLVNGRSDEGVAEWDDLLDAFRRKGIPVITVGQGDAVRYGPNEIRILSPDQEWLQSGELNDTGLVELASTTGWKALLAADTGLDVENALGEKDMSADILKVGHHGSKYSTGAGFLKKVRPRLALVSAGAGNTYGHPASSTLVRLEGLGIPFLRTDRSGSITVRREGNELAVSTER